MLHNHRREEHGKILTELTKIVEAGGLKPIIDSTYKLEAAGDAHARLDSKKVIGKVIIEN